MPETTFALWANACVLVSSNNMLAHGRQKVAAAGFSAESVRLVKGDAQDLSRTLATDALFDAATMAFAIRNVPDRLKALKSIRSHLKPGARFAILGS
jgi:demethylmenaquinone methyltransferase/2-methoxy-6-polyprenyl-1,4-benzoquinol methylase